MKARLLAVLLVSALVLALTGSMVLAQEANEETVEEGRDNGNANTTIVDCSQVQNAFSVSQGQYGNANAVAQYQSDAVAVVSQEMNISQSQVNSCLVNVGGGGDGDGGGDGGDDTAQTGDTPANTAPAKTAPPDAAAAVIDDTIPKADELPETGGTSLLALGAGLALVAGGGCLIRFRR